MTTTPTLYTCGRCGRKFKYDAITTDPDMCSYCCNEEPEETAATTPDPKTYRCTFRGRKVGSIGLLCLGITHEVQATDEEAARLACYDHYEHISKFAAEELTA